MRSDTRMFTLLPLLALLTMCAPAQPPRPQPDPGKEEIAVLQKQLLELQNYQHETRIKLDEANAAVEKLSLRLKAVEDKQASLSKAQNAPKPQVSASPGDSGKKSAPARGQKSIKKKTRRQE